MPSPRRFSLPAGVCNAATIAPDSRSIAGPRLTAPALADAIA
jgi:hypothetical protein